MEDSSTSVLHEGQLSIHTTFIITVSISEMRSTILEASDSGGKATQRFTSWYSLNN